MNALARIARFLDAAIFFVVVIMSASAVNFC